MNPQILSSPNLTEIDSRKINQRLGKQTSRLAGIAAGAAFLLLGSYLILERLFSQFTLPPLMLPCT
jgi:hypothetical protein